jgi:hypothetical protein
MRPARPDPLQRRDTRYTRSGVYTAIPGKAMSKSNRTNFGSACFAIFYYERRSLALGTRPKF